MEKHDLPGSKAGMNILGINAYHGDSAACLVIDGCLVAAAEEERFTRLKHWAGFPAQSIRYCLETARLKPSDIDHVALNRNPRSNFMRKIGFMLSRRPGFSAILNRAKNASKIAGIGGALEAETGAAWGAKIHQIEHHRAHLASAFFVSSFEEAALVSVDGFGDFVSTMWGTGKGGRIRVDGQVNFPHSLGLFYLAMTQYLGFPNYGDEYKVMGLAPYGEPKYIEALRRVVRLEPEGRFSLDLGYFLHHAEGVSMVWDNGEPKIGCAYSDRLIELLGPARLPQEPLEQRHKDIAASVQAMYEEVFFALLKYVRRKTGLEALALAGGCAMNSVANGKVYVNTGFKKMYVQCAAGDAGGAIGAAFTVWNQTGKRQRQFVMDHAYWGPDFTADDIAHVLRENDAALKEAACRVEYVNNETGLCLQAAQAIADGKVVGWFQGRMEWGPRALGNRSILADPRRADMKDILNAKIKRRESFRPFAPSVLRESVSEWFETDDDVPFMLQVYQIREAKRALIPAVTHVNGSGRLQTVTGHQNARYYKLISFFQNLTGIPMVLNTSFNENEPIVCTPAEALDCFLRTRMDILVLGNYFLRRNDR